MKSEIELLIHNLQNEFDYLKYELDLCVAQGDFEYAHLFKKSLNIVASKLKVAKQLLDPNISKIQLIEFRIKNLNQKSKGFPKNPYHVEEEDADIDKHSEAIKKMTEEFMSKRNADQLEMLEEQLQQLKSKPAKPLKADNDQFTSLLEQLANDSIASISFEISERYMRLQIAKTKTDLQLKLIPMGNASLNNAFPWHHAPTLSQLGFDLESGKKIIPDFDEYKIQEALQLITILLFDFFHFVGDEVLEVKVE